MYMNSVAISIFTDLQMNRSIGRYIGRKIDPSTDGWIDRNKQKTHKHVIIQIIHDII